jgi:predicted ATPase
MISYINIKNFKSLKNIYLKPANLNLCFGMNGMGKSSLLQIFLLLRQSFFKGILQETGLLLQGGNLVTIGTGKDAFYQNAGKDELMTIEIKDTKGAKFLWNFRYEAATDILPLESLASNVELKQASLFTHHFQYLSAEHLSPQKVYHKSEFEVARNKNIGIKGEYAVHYLSDFGLSEKISHKNFLHPNSHSDILLHQTIAWLSEISPGTKINVEDIKGTDLVRMGIQFETKDGYTNDFLPINVGFGITYVLPLIVALLKAQPDDLVLIENPESHLHPKGQTAIGKLMALAAQNGVQIFAESHSDHVINGARVAVKESLIDKDNVSVYYFDRKPDMSSHETKITHIKIDKFGELSNYPEGLLDEWNNLLMRLI